MAALERYFITFNRWLLILMLAAMALIIFANVGLRYLTSQSIEWAEEVARHLMIWVTFVGAGLVYRYGGHVAIDNLQDALPKKLAMFLRVVTCTCFGRSFNRPQQLKFLSPTFTRLCQ
jgi:TRAP-type transport system small permease protein